MISSLAAWWVGVPTKLIRKTTLVQSGPERLPVHTLTFELPFTGAEAGGRTRPHAALRLDMGDVVKMVIPGYKPKSYSVSALRADEFDVTFKVYPNGRASGFLDRLAVGESMHTFGMGSGRVRQPGKFVGIVTYGVGITEGLPVARAELKKGDAEEVKLLWASRTMADTFWADDVKRLQEEYPGRFKIVHILSREDKEGTMRGRIDVDVLREVFGGWLENKEEARFLSVGTKEMMAMTNRLLTEAGFDMPKLALLPKS